MLLYVYRNVFAHRTRKRALVYSLGAMYSAEGIRMLWISRKTLRLAIELCCAYMFQGAFLAWPLSYATIAVAERCFLQYEAL